MHLTVIRSWSCHSSNWLFLKIVTVAVSANIFNVDMFYLAPHSFSVFYTVHIPHCLSVSGLILIKKKKKKNFLLVAFFSWQAFMILLTHSHCILPYSVQKKMYEGFIIGTKTIQNPTLKVYSNFPWRKKSNSIIIIDSLLWSHPILKKKKG